MITFDRVPKKDIISNEKFKKLKGYLSEEEAKATFGEFLYNNLGFSCQLLLGVEIFPFQEIILRGWFDHNFNFFVATRGGSKSWLAAIFCILYPIFHPNTKIVLASNTFRSTRRILKQIELFLNAKGAILAKQCFTNNIKGKIEFTKRADEMIIEINGGSIVALPLNDKIRGTRADVLIGDEFLQIPEDIYKSVLVPFLAAKNDIQEQLALEKEEEALIEAGIINESQKTSTNSKKKILALTSASYDFEFCYRLFKEWVDNIENPRVKKDKRSYFVARLSYLGLPEQLIDKDIAEEIKAGGEGTAAFSREWMGQFASSSDGYFNIGKLHSATVKPGFLPTVQLKGSKDGRYLLAVDPSYSSSKSSDFFAMAIYLINSDNRSITLTHSYGVAGGDLKDHINYMFYLFMSFNIVLAIFDLGGNSVNFVETCNESQLFKSANVNLKFIEGDFDQPDYTEQCKLAKASYNLSERRVCYRQKFHSAWILTANEYLQTQIAHEKVCFASNLEAHSEEFEKAVKSEPPFIIKEECRIDENRLIDFIATQDDLIEQTKRQVALIEPSVTTLGTMQFNLPRHIRNSKKPERARKDLYTTLLLANWAAKIYWDFTYKTEADDNSIPWMSPVMF